MQNNKNP